MSHIKKIALVVAAYYLVIPSVYALENLNEEDLSQTTGQDGISAFVLLPAAGWTAQEMALTDKTGIPNTVKPGFDFHSGTVVAKNLGLKVCLESSINGSCSVVNVGGMNFQGIRLDMDTVGNVSNTGAMLNIQASLLAGSGKLRVYLNKIALRNGLGGNESTFIDFNNPDTANGNKDYFDLVPSDGKLFTLQLGNESSGHMISFGSTAYNTIDFGQIRITDKTDTGVGGNNLNLRFGLKLDNVNLTGMGIDIGAAGLVFSASSFVTPMDITFSNIAVGNTITGTNTATDMGTIGIKGLQVTDYSFTIAGKS